MAQSKESYINLTVTIPEQHHPHHPHPPHDRPLTPSTTTPKSSKTSGGSSETNGNNNNKSNSEPKYPNPLYSALAGGFGGMVGDSLMHSLDTVKTRQQGASHIAKYSSTIPAYWTIFKEEGFRRGLYGGYGAAMLGSFPSSAVFFLTYETLKKVGIENFGMNETVVYLGSGFLGDFAASIFYVPSEVLKTRLQLQGRYNNPYFKSGYNYSSTWNAAQQIVKVEGWRTLFFGYKATLFRDLPFSALQFAFYEKFRQWAFMFTGVSSSDGNNSKSDDGLPLSLELLTGAAAGGLAGIITTPTDVVKTRMQTQNENNSQLILKSNSILKSLATVYQRQGVVGLFSEL
ncbi:unnamed protein product [Ambrosiozyma monospora]|uniref:Unnamed protein product n=1 Tax=Ambrosiozyma monospora TaxID=43982 RepID=A0ACB5SSN1_AMBMO|nr:unnamed protein product [Ambrosiozyma monospora]